MSSNILTKDGKEINPTVPDEHLENGLKHVSKSRIKTYLNCPRKFYYKYWCDNRSPGSYHTEKGSEIHRAYEHFHENLIEWVREYGDRPEWYADVMGNWEDYSQWLEPHIRNFWEFEDDRWDASVEYALDKLRDTEDPSVNDVVELALETWLPIGVEVEGRLEDPPVGDIPWMGYADALLHAASMPEVEADDGVVVVDYKTGKVQDPKYRSSGIYLEGEFYGWLFEADPEFEHEIAAVAGYYPQEDELVVSPYPDFGRRNEIMDAVNGMQQPPEIENYDYEEQPLCHYGHGRCFFYDECPSDWGMAGGAGYHNKAEPDGSVTPKDE